MSKKTWWNSARCVASSVSLRKTRSVLKHLRGTSLQRKDFAMTFSDRKFLESALSVSLCTYVCSRKKWLCFFTFQRSGYGLTSRAIFRINVLVICMQSFFTFRLTAEEAAELLYHWKGEGRNERKAIEVRHCKDRRRYSRERARCRSMK